MDSNTDIPVQIPSRQARAVASNQEMISAFLEWHRNEKGSSPKTIEAYATDLGQFSTFLGARRVRAVGRGEIRDYQGHIIAIVKASSAARKISALRSFYKFLLVEGMIERDPTEDLALPKREKALPKHLESAEIDTILPLALETGDELKRRDQAMLEVLYGGSLRVSEIIAAQVADADFINGTITVLGKGNKERKVPFRGRATVAIRNYLESRSAPSRWLFADRRGQPLTRQRIWQIVNKCSALIGRHVHPHMFRHSCGTHMVWNGAEIRTVQIILGHSQVETTEVYTHVSPVWVRKNYFHYHPRATEKSRQMKLQLELEPILRQGLVLCTQCRKPVCAGSKNLCALHLRLNNAASKRAYERNKARSKKLVA